MRAVRIVDGAVVLTDVAEPADDVVASVRAVSICGTDLGFLGMGDVAWTLGHELSVVVDGVPFAVEPIYSCGSCAQCASGNGNRCEGAHGNLGIFEDGGLAERVGIKQRDQLTALPAGLAPADACCAEPAAVAWRGVRLARIEPGERVCVVGGGSIGLMAVACLRHHGVDPGLDARHAHQRVAGERLGASLPSGLYDAVIDTAGSESGLARCLELVRPGGRVVLLGVYYGLVPLPGVPLIMKEATVLASMAYAVDDDGRREFVHAAEMLAANPDIARAIITHRFPLEDAAEAFRVAADRAAGAIKVVVEAEAS